MARAGWIVLVVLAVSRAAHAAPIAWTGDDCGDAAALATAIEVQRGAPLVDDDALRVAVAVTADRGARVARIALTTDDGVDEREIRGRDCAALVDAVALIVVLALEELPPRVVTPPTLPVLAEVPPPPPWTPRPAPPVVVADDGPRIGARLRVGAVAETGALPGLGLGVAATLAVTHAWLGVELAASAHDPRDVDVVGAGARVSLISGAASACGHRGELALCLGAALGRMTAAGTEVMDARTATRRWSAVQVGARWRRALRGRLGVAAALDATVALDRPRFVLDDGTLVYRPAAAGLALSVAVEVRFR